MVFFYFIFDQNGVHEATEQQLEACLKVKTTRMKQQQVFYDHTNVSECVLNVQKNLEKSSFLTTFLGVVRG
jgi:hypothetical protein